MQSKNELTSLSVIEAAALLKSRSISSRELTEAYLKKTEKNDEGIRAYITVCKNRALLCADKADETLRIGEFAPLCGIPYALKDNICTKGLPTTCASKLLENFIPPYDAFVAEELNFQNAVLLGKTNLDEFGMGSSTENSAFFKTSNPLDKKRSPGGSSGGSAAAVCSDEAAFALGSDTGGSVRLPSAFCGIVGMAPTYGAVSRNGLIAFASSLDRIGPMTKNVKDNAFVLSQICKKDVNDPTSVGISDSNLLFETEKGVSKMRLAIPEELFSDSVSADIKREITKAAETYEKLGARVDYVSMPSIRHALSAYYIISSGEASANLSRYDGIRFGKRAGGKALDEIYKNTRSAFLGDEVKRRIILGTFILSAGYCDKYYKKALAVKERLKQEFDALLSVYDAIISPVYPSSAPIMGKSGLSLEEVYKNDAFTVPSSIAGLPSLTLPCGKDDLGLPVGIQIIGKAFSESKLYRIGFALESEVAEVRHG